MISRNLFKGGYEQLKHVAEAFEVDVIIVLDQEKLKVDLVRDMPNKTVVWLPKSNGVVERTQGTTSAGNSWKTEFKKIIVKFIYLYLEQRMEDSSTSIKQYYYGFQNALFPHSFDVKFTDLKEKIFKIGAPSLPESCMPLGKTVDDNETKVVAVGNDVILLNTFWTIFQLFYRKFCDLGLQNE